MPDPLGRAGLLPADHAPRAVFAEAPGADVYSYPRARMRRGIRLRCVERCADPRELAPLGLPAVAGRAPTVEQSREGANALERAVIMAMRGTISAARASAGIRDNGVLLHDARSC